MTKTKSQLRAEAVERLRKLNCMDVDCYQLLEATVDDAGEKVGYRVEIRKLIDLLTDEEPRKFGVTAEQVAKASADFFDNLPSVNGKNGDFLPTTAEDEDANCKKADSLQDSRENLGSNLGSGSEVGSEVDSREKLETDMRAWKDSVYSFSDDELYAKVTEWLDRQAAITRAECDKPNWDYCESCEQFKAMQDRIDELEAALKGERNNFYQAMESCKHWQREYESLKVASETYRDGMHAQARRVGEVKAERDRYRDKLGRALDAAHEIVRMMEVER